jgi:hypothetical protein
VVGELAEPTPETVLERMKRFDGRRPEPQPIRR